MNELAACWSGASQEILGFIYRANLDIRVFGHRIWAAFYPFHSLFHRPDLPDPESRDELLGLSERTIDDAPIGTRKVHPLTLGSRLQAVPRQHDARLYQLFVEFAHVGEKLLRRQDTRFTGFGRFDKHHNSHFVLPGLVSILKATIETRQIRLRLIIYFPVSFRCKAVRYMVNASKETIVTTLLAKIVVVGRTFGPYLALEILLPGGSLVALLLWAYRTHAKKTLLSAAFT